MFFHYIASFSCFSLLQSKEAQDGSSTGDEDDMDLLPSSQDEEEKFTKGTVKGNLTDKSNLIVFLSRVNMQ